MTIVKVKGGYKVRSSKGKLLGAKGGKPFGSRAVAVKREKQIVFFKNLGKSSSLRRKVRNKSLLRNR